MMVKNVVDNQTDEVDEVEEEEEAYPDNEESVLMTAARFDFWTNTTNKQPTNI